MLSKMKTVTTYFTNIIAACNQATVAGLDWDVDADQNQGIGFRETLTTLEKLSSV